MKSEDSIIKELERKLRKAKKGKKIADQQMILVRAWFRKVLRFAPSDFVLPHDVCGLLCHPLKDTGFCFCQQVFAVTSGSPVHIEGLVVVPKKECEKSLPGKHCWHRTLSNVVIPGKTKMDEQCCFCGEAKEIMVELPPSYSYSYDSSKHGPFAPVYQVLY